ncbi:MAG: hypothetical protein ACODAE_04385, partial [Gemmatimonadota bacterium]
PPRLHAGARPASRLRPLWIAKWAALAAGLGSGGYGFWAQHEAGRHYDTLDRVCADSPTRCGAATAADGPGSADPEIVRREREAARLEERAVVALIGSQAALAGAVVLFLLDMRESDAPPNVVYEPPALRLAPNDGGGVRLRARVRPR